MSDPVRSMTGFGTAAFEVEGTRYRIEVRSVNHRNLNIRFHLPPGFSHTENAIKRVLRDEVVRGSIDVSVMLEDEAQHAVEVRVDEVGAAAMMKALDALATRLGCASPTLELVLRQGDFVTVRSVDVTPEVLTVGVVGGLQQALVVLDGARQNEGAELAIDLDARLGTLTGLLDRLESASPEVYSAYEARLRHRLEEVVGALGKTVDEARIASELVIFSDRCDVTEETVRARAHIVAFRALLAGERPSGEQLIGKRCEFLTQELGREFNTIGSKCRETSMSSDVVTAKVELERIREQVHNIA